MKINIGISCSSLQIVTDTIGLPLNLAAAVIIQESSGNTWAYNPEPKWRYMWNVATGAPFRKLTHDEIADENPPKDFPAPVGVLQDAEWWGQQASWGLMQVMGAVAREHGLKERFLTILCDPSRGVRHGCLYLANCMRRYPGDVEDAIAAYNAGGVRKNIHGQYDNQSYVDSVMGYYGRLNSGDLELEG